jgi:hypothetical protein
MIDRLAKWLLRNTYTKTGYFVVLTLWGLLGTVLISLFLSMLTGCVEWLDSGHPDGTRPPVSAEWAELHVVKYRWEEKVGPIKDECVDMFYDVGVLVANRDQMLQYCWRDEPGRCAAGESLSKYGCAAGCIVFGPTIVVSDKLEVEHWGSLLRHEMTHALGNCMRVWNTDHQNPLLWGPDGVTPL